MDEALLERFMSLCLVEARSKAERPMADRLVGELARLGLSAREDQAGASIGGQCGNLLTELPPQEQAEVWVALLAHMDAVPPGCGEAPYIENGIVRTKGQILSADDRAGIAIVLRILEELRREPLRRVGVQAIFTVSEEQGLGGAECLDPADLKGSFCVVLDTGGPPGQINSESPTAKKFRVDCEGRSAHAGIEPEKGINALSMASAFIASLPSGRLDGDTTFSFTTLRAGTATNVIPGQAVAEGELRTFRPEEADRLLALMDKKAREIEARFGGTVTVTLKDQFPPFRIDPKSPHLDHLLSAAREAGFRGFLNRSGGGSDANSLNAKGVPAVNVGVGYRHGHSPQEHLVLEEFEGTYRWILTYLRRLEGSGL